MLAALPTSAYGLLVGSGPAAAPSARASSATMALDRPIRVAVIGGGPSGSCAAEIFAKARCRPHTPAHTLRWHG